MYKKSALWLIFCTKNGIKAKKKEGSCVNLTNIIITLRIDMRIKVEVR